MQAWPPKSMPSIILAALTPKNVFIRSFISAVDTTAFRKSSSSAVSICLFCSGSSYVLFPLQERPNSVFAIIGLPESADILPATSSAVGDDPIHATCAFILSSVTVFRPKQAYGRRLLPLSRCRYQRTFLFRRFRLIRSDTHLTTVRVFIRINSRNLIIVAEIPDKGDHGGADNGAQS